MDGGDFYVSDSYDVRDVDITMLDIGPNRIVVAKILRDGGWSYRSIREMLDGVTNWAKATGLESAYKLAAAGATIRVDDRTYHVPDRSYFDPALDVEQHPEWEIAWTRSVFGPGHSISRRELPRRWAKEFVSTWS